MCSELDSYLTELEKTQGMGAVSAFAAKIPCSRQQLWRYRHGIQKPTSVKRKIIKRLTYNIVRPEHFNKGV